MRTEILFSMKRDPGISISFCPRASEVLKVFQEWNSWGFYARSFLAVDEKDKAKRYRLAPTESDLGDKNFAATHLLNTGQFLITDIHLCDGYWAVEPKLPEDVPARLTLTGIFEIKADAESKAQNVWTGRIESEPKSVFIDRFCVRRLNETRLDDPEWRPDVSRLLESKWENRKARQLLQRERPGIGPSRRLFQPLGRQERMEWLFITDMRKDPVRKCATE